MTVRMATPRHYLMCPPTYFEVRYSINPWMDPDRPVDRDRAMAQWRWLVDSFVDRGHKVDLIDPVSGLPDMVFAANAATIVDVRVLVASERCFHPVGLDLSELRAAGGGIKCCVLEIRAA